MAHTPGGPSQLVYGCFFPPPDGAFPRPPPDGFPVVLGQLPPPPLPPPPLGIFHPSCRLTSAHEVRDTVALDYRKPQTASSSPMPCARRTLAGAPTLIASRNERHASPQELSCSLRWVHHHGCPGHSLYRHWRAVWRAGAVTPAAHPQCCSRWQLHLKVREVAVKLARRDPSCTSAVCTAGHSCA